MLYNINHNVRTSVNKQSTVMKSSLTQQYVTKKHVVLCAAAKGKDTDRVGRAGLCRL